MNSTGPTLQSLAERFASSRDTADRDALCEAALPLVRKIAGCVMRRLPPYFSVDDLVGDGSVGLLRAADRYDPSMGASFEHWAGRIVRGSIFNGLRRMDFIPERLRRDVRSLEASRLRIARDHGASPSDEQAARGAGLDARKLRAVKLAVRRSTTQSLDIPAPNSEDTQPLRDKLCAPSDDDPVSRYETVAMRHAVGQAVAALPPRQRSILRSVYARNASYREIGACLGVTKQRVSQLHGRAILGLRSVLAPYADP